MHVTERHILEMFKASPAVDFTTTQLVRASHEEKYLSLQTNITSHDKKKSLEAKRLKATLHRKTLYHVNKLISEGIIKVSSVKGRGEKSYTLAIEHGELIVNRKRSQLTLSKPITITSFTQELEEKGIVIKYNHENWLSKINCAIIECENNERPHHLINKLQALIKNTNDCVGLHGFEKILLNITAKEIKPELQTLDSELSFNGKRLSIFIDLDKIHESQHMEEFIREFAHLRPTNIALVFQAKSRTFRETDKIAFQIAREFQKQDIKINIQNTEMKKAPVIIGRAGTYTLDDKTWEKIKIWENPRAISIASVSMALDIGRQYYSGLTASAFREIVSRVSKTLFKAHVAQMKLISSSINQISKESVIGEDFLKYQRPYIRFWNYNGNEEQQEIFPDLILSCKQETEKFCKLQRSIYNSCGLPTNFDIAFSSTFNRFSSELTPRNYVKTTIRSLKDYTEEDTIHFIRSKERLSLAFNGGDRSRFFRKGDFNPSTFGKEAIYLMNSCNLQLITFDFNETRGEIKLTEFFEKNIA